PPKLGLENEKLYNIRRFYEIIDPRDKKKVAAWTRGDTGDIEYSDWGISSTYRLTDRGIDPMTETLVHEIGHHFDDENPKWKQFKALSGWHDVGDAKATSLKKFKDGDHVKGKQLGLADKETEYVVTRAYGRMYVYKSNAKFGVGGSTGDYAKSNPLDDFAETMMQYLVVPDDLKRESLDKYNFMKEFLGQ